MRSLTLLFLLLTGIAHVRAENSAPAGFEQNIGAALPLQAEFADEGGRIRPLGAITGGKPAILYFTYLRCPQLCSVVSDATIDTLRQLQASVGPSLVVLSISIDPTDTPAMAREWKEREVSRYGRTGAGQGWHVLTGNAQAIAEVTAAAGFHFSFDPRSRQYAHPTGIIVVTPSGLISRYFLGVDFPAKAVSSALVRASQNRTGERAFDLVLNCLEGGLPGGRYGTLIWRILMGSVLLTVILLFGGIGRMLFVEFRRRRVTP